MSLLSVGLSGPGDAARPTGALSQSELQTDLPRPRGAAPTGSAGHSAAASAASLPGRRPALWNRGRFGANPAGRAGGAGRVRHRGEARFGDGARGACGARDRGPTCRWRLVASRASRARSLGPAAVPFSGNSVGSAGRCRSDMVAERAAAGSQSPTAGGATARDRTTAATASPCSLNGADATHSSCRSSCGTDTANTIPGAGAARSTARAAAGHVGTASCTARHCGQRVASSDRGSNDAE